MALAIFMVFFAYIFREEIRELETKVQKERERYKISTQNSSGGFSAIPMLPINASVILFASKSCLIASQFFQPNRLISL